MDEQWSDDRKNALVSLADTYRTQVALLEAEKEVNEKALDGASDETRTRVEEQSFYAQVDVEFEKERLRIVYALLAEASE